MPLKMHKGKLADCNVCTPQQDKKRRERRVKQEATQDVYLRREVATELGDTGTREQRFQLNEKYGVSAPRIDRNITRPKWMGVNTWIQKKAQWVLATKGLVQAKQEKRASQSGRVSNNSSENRSRTRSESGTGLSEQTRYPKVSSRTNSSPARNSSKNPRINPNPRPNQPR